MVGIWVNQEGKERAKVWDKWCEEKHRSRKNMKRPVYWK